MVRAWAAPQFVRQVPAPPPLDRSADSSPAVLAPARCPGRPGSRRFLHPLLGKTYFPEACFEVDPTGATHCIRSSKNERDTVFQLPAAFFPLPLGSEVGGEPIR